MTNLLNLKSDSSSHLQMSTLHSVLHYGEELAPRGKRIREMRPSVIEFTDPRDRIVQLEGRHLNVFFHAAEAIWVALGRSDVEFLTMFNKNMATFSDDGVYFNAPYGERLRSWGKNDANGDIRNPIDQLYSVYRLLQDDEHTRQATAVIGDPRYDNANYALSGGRDVACNREIFFKVRNNKLDITVTNRSSDINWGLFAANLPVFTTLQELVASWLSIEPGTYTQLSDSVHAYLDDYGSHLNGALTGAHGPHDYINKYAFQEPQIRPRSYEASSEMLLQMEGLIERIILNDDIVVRVIDAGDISLDNVLDEIRQTIDDPYFEMLALLMLVYRVHLNDRGREGEDEDTEDITERRVDTILTIMDTLPASVWKRSALTFLGASERTPEGSRDIFYELRDELDEQALITKTQTTLIGGEN